MESISEIRKQYYKLLLETFMSSYGSIIKNAPDGHCMKVTGFPLSVLKELRILILRLGGKAECFILSETHSGLEYVTPTKLIELRNDLSKPLLILIPVNSNTSAEDSYGNATFQDLSVKRLDEILLSNLKEELQKNSSVKSVLQYVEKNLNPSIIDKINYLLYIKLNELKDEAIGNGIFYLGLIPDSSLCGQRDYIETFLRKNDECIMILADFSSSIADRVISLPIKPHTIQKEVAGFLKKNSYIHSREELCHKILEYPDLNFSRWSSLLTDVLELGKLHVTKVEISGKAFIETDGDYEILVDSKKGAKVKLRIYFSPKPSQYEALKKIRIALFNADGFYLEQDRLISKKITENSRDYREIQFTIEPNSFENGSYFFHVYAEDENGTVLNTKDEFQNESFQQDWIKEEEKGEITKDEFQQQRRALLTSDTLTFFLRNKDEESDPEEIGTRMKICNLLMAYFRYRIELNRKGKELTVPERVAIIDKKGKVSKKVSDDELHSWQDSTHLETFQLRYDSDNNYQIPLSKKLLSLERSLLKKSNQLSRIDAIISDNYTDISLTSISTLPVEMEVPRYLIEARHELFESIKESAPEQTGVIETYDVFNHIDLIKNYINAFRQWTSDVLSQNPTIDQITKIQAIDTVALEVEMPNGKRTITKLITPLHPLRLAWLVNIYEQYEEWEQKTHDDERFRKPDVWFKKLDKLFYGELTPEVSPLILLGEKQGEYLQYIGELCFGWGLYGNPFQDKEDTFSTGFRQLKSYLSLLLNIGIQYRIDSDVNQNMVYRLLHKYIVQHPYVNKLIINLFNAGDAAVFADNLVRIEKDTKDSVFDIHYEIRLFCNDKRFPQGEALKELMNPETSVSEEAENFSQADENRLFPKLRFSINSIEEFVKDPLKFPAHLSFLINPFPTQASLKRNKTNHASFFLNGVVMRPIVEVENMSDKEDIQWQRFISDTPMSNSFPFALESQNLFGNFQYLIASGMSTDHELSVPSISLNIKDTNSEMLSLVHDVSDWVITFDKNMGPEYYDMPVQNNETPYLLDYIPSAELNGISSFLTCRPTSEIEGIMAPHFKAFGIDVSDKTSFMELLGDIRSVSSSMIMQLESSRNKVFEVLGTTLMKRMLKGKGLLQDSFIIPIDLHQSLFAENDSNSAERADDLLVDLHPSKREIVFTVIEIKCRQSLTNEEKFALEEKMLSQINNTILALRTNFDPEYRNPDRLDRELKTIELQNLLLFYSRRAARYKYLHEETAKEYEDFILSLQNEDYTIRFKKMGFVYEFKSPSYQDRETLEDAVFYILGKPMIERIIEDCENLKTSDLHQVQQDEELRKEFETSDRILREESFRIANESFSSANETENIEEKEVENNEPSENENENLDTKEDGKSNMTEDNKKEVGEKAEINESGKEHKISNDIGGHSSNSEKESNKAEILDATIFKPQYEILIGKTDTSGQYGILGESVNGHRKIAIDLSETNTISLFGVQGGGKSYTIGTVTEMTLKQIPKVNYLPGPMASVIFHYSESQDYAPEFTSMIYPNDVEGQLKKLKEVYGAEADRIEDVIMLCPQDKVEDRKEEYPSLEIFPIAFHSTDLNVQDWQFLLKAVGNDSTYIAQLKQIMKGLRKNLNLEALKEQVENSELLSASQKTLAKQRLAFAEEYIDDSRKLGSLLRPGRLIIVDLRDEWISEDDALGLFVIMLNIFAGVKEYEGKKFNKFIVFDEAHKYMDNKDLTNTIVTAIREMRHKGVSLMIASQDPMSLPNQIIELSSAVLLHKFNSPQWVKHIQKSITQMQSLSSTDMASLVPGEAYLWATKATDKGVTLRPMKINTRPRVTKHGGDTIKAI